MIRFLTALALLFAIPAFAQQPIPIGGGGGSGASPCYYPVGSSSCTFSQGVTVGGPATFTALGTSSIGSQSTYDYSVPSGNTRAIYFNDTIAPSGTTSNIYEHMGSFLTFAGPGTANGEINLMITDFTVNTGETIAGPSEGYESRLDNNGTISSPGEWTGYTVDIINCSTCSANTFYGMNPSFYQDNTTAAAVTSYIAYGMPAMLGGGSLPTNYYFLQNKDSNAVSATAGTLDVGSFGAGYSNTLVSLVGLDSSNSDFLITAKDSSNSTAFFVTDEGQMSVKTYVQIGVAGSVTGEVKLLNGTSGSLLLQPPSSGALSGTVVLPNASTTLAGLAVAQTFSAAQTFSSTLNLTGLTADTGKSDATVCDVTSTGLIYYGSGTGGICLSTSTARFKDNIEATLGSAASAFSAINSFMRLDTVAWNYKPGHGFDPSHRYWGWTAEQMENVYPALVGHDEQGRPNSVDMMGVLPRAVNAIQVEEYEIIGLAIVCLILAGWCAMLQREAAKTRKRLRAIEARIV